MRAAYALIGFAWLIIIVAGAYAFNHKFTQPADTVQYSSPTYSIPSSMSSAFTLKSPAFEDGAMIPSRFTCDAGNPPAGGNPPLSISGVPEGARSLALIMDDPDVPKQLKPDGVFDHWILFNIPPPPAGGNVEIASGATVGIAGANGAGKNAYTGPCPPSQYEPSTHRYVFKLYALDTELSLQAGASKAEIEKAMQGHSMAQAQLIGKYKRQ